MKRNSFLIIFFVAIAFFFINSRTTIYSSSIIEKIRLTDAEIPEGYMFGHVPKFAQNILKNNPWNLDNTAIRKMTNRIYPGGEYSKVSDLHMSIITNKNKPYGNDIGCYIFIFKNEKSAEGELTKLNEYVSNNSDRSIVIDKKNLAIYLYVNNVKNFELIKTMSDVIKKKLDTL